MVSSNSMNHSFIEVSVFIKTRDSHSDLDSSLSPFYFCPWWKPVQKETCEPKNYNTLETKKNRAALPPASPKWTSIKFGQQMSKTFFNITSEDVQTGESWNTDLVTLDTSLFFYLNVAASKEVK